MPSHIPEKTTVACENLDQALMAIAMAKVDAQTRKHGVHLETTFPEGRMLLVIGKITVEVSQPKLPKRR